MLSENFILIGFSTADDELELLPSLRRKLYEIDPALQLSVVSNCDWTEDIYEDGIFIDIQSFIDTFDI